MVLLSNQEVPKLSRNEKDGFQNFSNDIQDNYKKIEKIFFSENKDIETHREKLINIFENDRFDKK